ncbi:serine/threonine protein kinase, partial [Rhodopirellula bahusiensis]
MVQSGLADASVPPIWAADFANDHGGQPPSDPASLASWLVKTGRVAKYPVSRLLRHTTWESDFPDTPILRIPPVTLVAADKTAPFPFSDWQTVVCDSPQPGGKRNAGWLRQIDPAGLPAETAENLRSHAELTHPSLQPIEILPLRNGPLGEPIGSRRDFAGVFSSLPAGKCLDPPKQAKSVQQTVAAMNPLCDALAAMHSGKMVHGEVHRDRVWISETGQWSLLRDPFASLANAAGQGGKLNRDAWLESSPDYQSNWSPERLADSAGHTLTVSDDVFSLGCLGYELRFGRRAFEGPSRTALPSELTTAVEQGATGDPLCRVLAAALAKDSNARFASVDQFAQALKVAASATPEEATVQQPVSEKQPPAKKQATVEEQVPVEKQAAIKKQTPVKSSTDADKPVVVEAAVAKAVNVKAGKQETSPTKPKADLKNESKQTTQTADASKPAPAQKPPSETKRSVEPTPSTPSENEEQPASVKTGVAEPEVAKTEVVEAAAAATSTTDASEPATTPIKPEAEETVAGSVAPTRRRRKRRNQKAWYGIYALCIPVLVLVVVLATRDKTPREIAKRVRPPVPKFIPRVSSDTDRPTTPVRSPARRPEPSTTGIQVVDNEQMLWAPPDLQADGEQISRATGLLPPGPAAVVTMDWQRLHQLQLLELFGPETQGWLETLNQWTGVSSDTISHVALAWFPGQEGVPEVAAAIRLSEPKSLETLLDAWDASAARGPGGETIYAGDTRDALAYYPMSKGRPAEAAEDLVDAFAVGSIARIGEVAEMGGAPVVLPRLLEELWQSARPDDAIAFLTQPNFLVSDARRWMDATSPALIPWIRQNLLADCGGMLVRVASTSENSSDDASTDPTGSYVEVRLASAPGVNPTDLATPLREQLDNAPRWAEDFLVTRDIDPSWRLLAARLPSMWAFAEENVRAGRVDRNVVWNAYLPPLALPQLALATLLATNTTTEPVSESMANNQTKLSIDEMLDRKMSVSFDQESLQFAVDTIAEEFNRDLSSDNQLPPIEIIGGDLQK